MKTRAKDLIGTGLNDREQLASVVGAVYGDGHQRAGLVEDVDALRRRVADLEAESRRRSAPWYLRWFFRGKETTLTAAKPGTPTTVRL